MWFRQERLRHQEPFLLKVAKICMVEITKRKMYDCAYKKKKKTVARNQNKDVT